MLAFGGGPTGVEQGARVNRARCDVMRIGWPWQQGKTRWHHGALHAVGWFLEISPGEIVLAANQIAYRSRRDRGGRFCARRSKTTGSSNPELNGIIWVGVRLVATNGARFAAIAI
jgi:hypothetical protein